MGKILAEEKPSLDDLAHFGVKGMKWGVKKAYTNRVTKQTGFYGRVAEGTGGKRDKVKAALYTPVPDMLKGGGLKGGAKRVDDRIKGHLDRVNSGKRTLHDTLVLVGGVSLGDVVKGARLAKQAPH